MTYHRMLASSIALAAMTTHVAKAEAFACSDVGLVMAVDVSGSVSPFEYDLERKGIAEAFRSEAVQAAIAGAGVVAVAVVYWGDTAMPVYGLDWRTLPDRAAVEALADEIETMPRGSNGDTGLGRGIWAALDKFDQAGFCAVRRLVNVSGDGRESITHRRGRSIAVAQARGRAVRMGVTVNALAIEDDDPDLSDYFEEHVISGSNAFVMTIGSHADFTAAIERKLAREIEPVVAVGPDGPGMLATLAE